MPMLKGKVVILHGLVGITQFLQSDLHLRYGLIVATTTATSDGGASSHLGKKVIMKTEC